MRRVFPGMLAHTHRHMGQAIAYTRIDGVKVPWPDRLVARTLLAAAPRLIRARAMDEEQSPA